MTPRKARRALALALLVPTLMSTAMWVIAIGLVLGRYWHIAVVVIAVLSAAVSSTVGEQWVSYVLLGARRPRLHQRHSLTPVARMLLNHGVPPDRFVLLVSPGNHVDARAVGQRTLLVTRGLVEALRANHLTPEGAAALIAHELGVLRASLARHEPATMILLAPGRASWVFVSSMWAAVAFFLPRRIMVACLGINAVVGLWLGFTQNPVMFVSTVFLGAVLATWWAFRAWGRARGQIGDQYLMQTGLAGIYADLLTAAFADDYTRDRAVRLRRAELLDVDCVPEGNPGRH